MKLFLIISGILFFLTSFFTKNERINALISKGISEYNQENYYTSAALFDTLHQQYQQNSEALYWNMANAWLNSSETDSAYIYYEILSKSKSLQIRSRAYNQIGLIKYFNGFSDEAELAFIESLKNDHTNSLAKFNLELLQKIKQESNSGSEDPKSRVKTLNQKKVALNKKLVESKAYAENQTGNEKKQLNQTKKHQGGLNNKDNENKNSQKDNKNDNGDNSTLKSRKIDNLSIEQQEALKILDIMKQNEIQYLQQIKRKSNKKQNLPQY